LTILLIASTVFTRGHRLRVTQLAQQETQPVAPVTEEKPAEAPTTPENPPAEQPPVEEKAAETEVAEEAPKTEEPAPENAPSQTFETVEDLVDTTRTNFVAEVEPVVNRNLVRYAVAVNRRLRENPEADKAKVAEEELINLKALLYRRTKRVLQENLELLKTGFKNVTNKAENTVESV